MIEHHREGSGPPLVLMHGVGLSWQIWRPVIGLLAEHFDVIACDSPGFGGSPPLPDGTEPAIPAYADAFAAFFAELGLERPHVSGNSMGGAIALELARRGAVASVSALSPAGFWTSAERRFCQESLRSLARIPGASKPALLKLAGTRAGATALFWQTFGKPWRMPREEPPRILRNAWASPALAGALTAFDSYTFADGEQLDPGTSVTVAWGVQDRLLPYRTQAPRARAMLPRARHLDLGAGHVPFFDDPRAVAEAIRSSAR
ncbi:MAG TPA: alpha/beta fold hydrolase [Solirubrobacteraceae bacterium]|nr:alpha/beta fold hydrolase [Solirubrobacteraceae bacterium]